MSSEQIAVLDGLELSSISVSPIGPVPDGRIGQLKAGSYPEFSGFHGTTSTSGVNSMIPISPIGPIPDGRIGQVKAQVDQYGRLIMPRVLSRSNVLDASEGANFSGGSSYAVGLPLMPSSVGLAGLGRLAGGYGRAGLGRLAGGYGKAGLGRLAGGYGRAGLGNCGCPMEGLGAPLMPVSPLGPIPDGRIGQQKAQVDQYGRLIMPRVLSRTNVVDASEGANYSGGSSYAVGLPLMPSSSGLADADLLDFVNTQGVLPLKRNVIDPSGGANYSGGASYAPGIPLISSTSGLAALEGRLGRKIRKGLKKGFTKVGQGLLKVAAPLVKIGSQLVPIPGAAQAGKLTSNLLKGAARGKLNLSLSGYAGLAELSVIDGLDAVPAIEFKMLTPEARELFNQTASAGKVAQLKQLANKARIARQSAENIKYGRQLAIARQVRRKLMALPPRAAVTLPALDAIIRGVAGSIANGGANTPQQAQLDVLIKHIGTAAARSPV